MYVVFIHGRPATGKYTIGKIVAEALDIPLFHNHLTVDLVGALFEFGTPEFIAMRERLWLEAFETSARADRSFVFTFNPEKTVAQETVDSMRTAIEGNGGRIVFVELVCDESEIEKRLGDESRGEFEKLTDVELYKKLRADKIFESPSMPEPSLSVDTTSLGANRSAEMIVEAVNQVIL